MILSGMARLGKDAELKTLQSGTTVCQLSLAYNYGKKSDDGKRAVQWVNAALFGKRGETLAQYLKKGSQHWVVLRDVCIRQYDTQDGRHGASLQGVVLDIELGPKSLNAPSHEAPNPNPDPVADGFDDSDDIPF